MKTLVIGAGVIGTIYGWALAEAGHDVTHLVRPGRRAALAEGIPLDLLDERKGHPPKGTYTYRAKLAEQIAPSDGYALILVPINAFTLAETLPTLAPQFDDALFLILSSNWSGAEVAERYLPRERFLFGYPDAGGTFRGNLLWGNLGAEVHLGEVDGSRSPKLQRVVQLFESAGMTPDLPDNILYWLWVHNAMSAPFAVGLWKNRDIQAYLKDTALLRDCFVAMRECLEVCRRRGADPARYDATQSFRLPPWLFPIVFRRLYRLNESMQRYTAHGINDRHEPLRNYESMLQTGRELGVPMPAMERLGVYAEKMRTGA